MKKVLYLIDGHALIFRAYYAFIRRPLVTRQGENTSAIFGFMRMLLRLMLDEKPEYLVCTFDTREKTFRHERYPEYKSKRLKAPEDLHAQVEAIKSIIGGLGIARVEMSGFEADDVIGTLSYKASEQGLKTVILSGDKDVLQLVNDNVTVYANKKGISDIDVLDSGRVAEVWGVKPGQIVDLLALMGDQSDDIPGVKGIGQKTATDLIRQFKSLDGVYEHLDEVESSRIAGLLEQGRESAYLSRDLITIRRDVPLDFDLGVFNIKDFPGKKGLDLLRQKELDSIVNDLDTTGVSRQETSDERKKEKKRGMYAVITSTEEFEKLEKAVRDRGIFSFDTESTGMDPITARIIGVSISVDEGSGYYMPIETGGEQALGMNFLAHTLKSLLEDPGVKKVGQNIKYDYVLLMKYGIFMQGIEGDSMIAAYLLNPDKQRYSLDSLAKEYLNYSTIHYKDVVQNKNETLLDYPLADVAEYAGEDSDIALRLVHVLEKRLETESLLDLYRSIEIPLLIVLGRMENTGVRVDPGCLAEMSKNFAVELKEIEKTIYEIAEEEFNIRSTKQLAKILFDKLKLPVIKKTKTGYSTDESVLEELAGEYKIAGLLLRHRKLAKFKSTYVDALPDMINPDTGRIHTSFNQTIAATGRLSSTHPNLQNIPIREPEGRAIRRAFVPEEGWLLVSADYSQIELRVLASLSLDPGLMTAFKNGVDIHRETASLLFNTDIKQVDDTQRRIAKTINFSIMYGISPYGLSRRLKISREEASHFIDMYFLKYAGVREYFNAVVEEAEKTGFVTTLLGRKRYIPDIRSENRNIYESARRIAINTPIQGTAADLIKKAMVDIDRELNRRKLKSRMLIQVHDELVFESPEDECALLEDLVKDKMENAISFQVPIVVNIAEGKNWEEAH